MTLRPYTLALILGIILATIAAGLLLLATGAAEPPGIVPFPSPTPNPPPIPLMEV